MANFAEQSKEEFHKGTEALEALAEEVRGGTVKKEGTARDAAQADAGDSGDDAAIDEVRDPADAEANTNHNNPVQGDVDNVPMGSYNQITHGQGHRI